MPIDRKDITRIARLARLQLGQEEVESLARECDRILSHFESLRQVDDPDAEPARQTAEATPPREDRVDPDPLHRPLEGMAPVWREGFFVLPRLPALDEDGGEPALPSPEEEE